MRLSLEKETFEGKTTWYVFLNNTVWWITLDESEARIKYEELKVVEEKKESPIRVKVESITL